MAVGLFGGGAVAQAILGRRLARKQPKRKVIGYKVKTGIFQKTIKTFKSKNKADKFADSGKLLFPTVEPIYKK